MESRLWSTPNAWRSRPTLNDRDVRARYIGVDHGSAHRAAVAEIAGDQALNPAHATVDEDGIQIEPVLFEDAHLFGDPVDHRRIAAIRDVGDVTFRVSQASASNRRHKQY